MKAFGAIMGALKRVSAPRPSKFFQDLIKASEPETVKFSQSAWEVIKKANSWTWAGGALLPLQERSGNMIVSKLRNYMKNYDIHKPINRFHITRSRKELTSFLSRTDEVLKTKNPGMLIMPETVPYTTQAHEAVHWARHKVGRLNKVIPGMEKTLGQRNISYVGRELEKAGYTGISENLGHLHEELMAYSFEHSLKSWGAKLGTKRRLRKIFSKVVKMPAVRAEMMKSYKLIHANTSQCTVGGLARNPVGSGRTKMPRGIT